MHRSEQFWKQVEKDRNGGMSLQDVYTKYDITTHILKRARSLGLLTDIRDRPQKRDWKLVRDSISNVGIEQTMVDLNITMKSLITAKQKGLLTAKVKPKKAQSYTIDELKQSVESSICIADVCNLLNITKCSFNYNRIRLLCEEHAVSLAHFDVSSARTRNRFVWDYSDTFVENSCCTGGTLRYVAIRHGLYTGKCNICGITDSWNDKPLTIELDHINGINNDNRISNLRWLCPNCHSQTPTYRNCNNRRKPSSL